MNRARPAHDPLPTAAIACSTSYLIIAQTIQMSTEKVWLTAYEMLLLYKCDVSWTQEDHMTTNFNYAKLVEAVFDQADQNKVEYEEGQTVSSDLEHDLREEGITDFDAAYMFFEEHYEQ